MPYPLLFHPILKPRVWGGRSLERLGKSLPTGEPIGESWEIADLPPDVADGCSIIANGTLEGQSLREAIIAQPKAILGKADQAPDARFPLLIKYLDAQQNLSVQVHPNAAYVQAHPGSHLKDEAWIILDHEPGAVIYKGLRPGCCLETFRSHLQTGRAADIVDALEAVPVEQGQCHYLPSGTVHALGAGVLVAEVQTPSDTTFRLYDWGRASREMHIEDAMEVLRSAAATPSRASSNMAPPMTVGGIRTTPLLRAEYFHIEQVEALSETPFEIITSDMPEVWMLLQGSGHVDGEIRVDFTRGATVLMPAAMAEASAMLSRGTKLLRVTLPSPLRGMIA